MLYKHILAAFYGQPLAILPEKMEAIRDFLRVKADGRDVDPEEIKAITAGRRQGGVVMAGRVAILPVFGVLSQRVGMMEEASGGVSTEAIGATLDTLVNDKQVRAIVMAFDSPGGSVAGLPELAAKIRAARDQKKVVGIADSMAASAAFWLIAQCSEVNVTPSGQIGSLGVITAHQDVSRHEEAEGVKTTVIASSKYKAEASPYAPLSEEAAAELQGKVNAYHAMFVQSVAAGRGVSEANVEKNYGQGRMLLAKAAVSAGMADHVATLETVLRRLGGDAGQGGAAARSPTLAKVNARCRAVQLEERGLAAR